MKYTPEEAVANFWAANLGLSINQVDKERRDTWLKAARIMIYELETHGYIIVPDSSQRLYREDSGDY